MYIIMSYPHQNFDHVPLQAVCAQDEQYSLDGQNPQGFEQRHSPPPSVPHDMAHIPSYNTNEQTHITTTQSHWNTPTNFALLDPVPQVNHPLPEQWWPEISAADTPHVTTEVGSSNFYGPNTGYIPSVRMPLPLRGRARVLLVCEEYNGRYELGEYDELRPTRLHRRTNTASSSSRARIDQQHSARPRTPRAMSTSSTRYVQA